MALIVASYHNHRQLPGNGIDRAKQRHAVGSMLEVDYGKIQIWNPAHDLQSLVVILRNVAHASDLRERFGDQIFQSIVVRQQKNSRSLHVSSFSRARVRASQ
jgi:hypothetical protein